MAGFARAAGLASRPMSISPELGEPRAVELEQGRIHYRERGSGRAVLFVNGVFVTGDFWRGVAPALAADHRCICPDWPLGAHSEPMRPQADLTFPGIVRLIFDFCDAVGVERVTLVGNDTGTAYCLAAAIDRPERVERLVLTSGDALEIFPPRVVQWLKAVAYVPGLTHLTLPLVRFRPVRRLPTAYGWVAKRPFPREISDSYVRPAVTSRLVRRDFIKIVRDAGPRYTEAAAARAHEYPNPALVAWSREDRVLPYRLGEELARRLPNARLVPIPDSYTFSPEDNPAALGEAIGAFLRET
jgi:pimeloyl-ACP methyl ester carboxylesterase